MCGIVGFTESGLEAYPAELILKKMLSRIHHRGPDEAGVFISENAGLGSVRLSIIDLSSGQQPLCDNTGRFWISFNGEIFNYRELRFTLEKRGCQFKTQSDTEVLLLAYREYGSECLSMLNGQFAFAVWDIKERTLFMARDRVGIRPLFYCSENERLVFASEIKSLFEFPGIRAQLNTDALQEVFTFWTSLSPHTVFEGIKELPPGHFMVFKNGKIKIQEYRESFFPYPEEIFRGTFEEAGEELEALLSDAVKLRLRADVPVGAYLSGGIDSSVIASLIRKNSPDGLLETFSIGFSDKEYDERGFQDEMVKKLRTDHHQTFCSKSDIATWFPRTVWHAEAPLLRTAPVPMFMLSQLVQENNIKVVMTGEGADEMLGGYNIFKEMEVRRFWARQPGSRLRPLLLKRLYPYLDQLKSMSPAAMKLFFGYKLTDVDSVLYSHLLRWNNTAKIRKMMNPDLLNDHSLVDDLEVQFKPLLTGKNHLAKAQYLESTIFMSGYLLSSQGDRMAMGNSIEGRYPFLDHRVMTFCNSLPAEFKLKGLKEKALLKHQFRNQLPPTVVNRSKQAYRAPLAGPFIGEKAPDYVQELLSEDYCKSVGVFDTKAVSVLLSRLTRNTNYSEVDQMGLVAVLSTHLLWKQFVDEFKPLSSRKLIDVTQRNAVRI